MALAQVSNQLLRSQGNDTTTVATNYPITGDGSTQLPLGLAEDYRGADGTSVTFEISAIPSGHRVTLSGAQGQESFDVMNGATGPSGAQGETGPQGPEGPQGPSGSQGPAGRDGVDGVSPTFRFSEDETGVTVYVSGAQGEDSFRLYNATGGEGTTYSAGPNIDIYDVEDQLYISGTDWTSTIESAVSSKMDKSESGNFYPMTGNPSGFLTAVDLSNYYQKNETSSREEISAAIAAIPGATDYSAGPNIDITNHVISSKDWSTDISNAATAGSAAATAWVSEQNYLTAHQDISDLMPKSESANFYPMTGNPSGFLTAVDLSNYYQKTETSSKEEISSALTGKLDKSESGNFYPMTGNPSGFLTAHQDLTNLDYVQNSAIGYTPSTFVSSISGHELYAESANHAFTAETANYVEGGWEYDSENHISSYNGSAFVGQNQATYDVKAGSNINVATADNTFTVSGKDWTNEITAASAYAASQAQGKTYTGVSPIVVNNSENKISADCIELSAGSGIDSTKLAQGVIEVSSHIIDYSAGNGIDSTKLADGVIEVSGGLDSCGLTVCAYSAVWSDVTAFYNSVKDNPQDYVICIPYSDKSFDFAYLYSSGVANIPHPEFPTYITICYDTLSYRTNDIRETSSISFQHSYWDMGGVTSHDSVVGVRTTSTVGAKIFGEYNLNGDTITADCSAFGMYEQANSPGSYQLMATAYNNTGWHGYGYTMSNSETVLMNNVSSIAQNYAASAVSSHVVPMAYADITYSGVRNVIFNNGIVIPYETTQGYGTFYDFVGSAVADSTSSFIFRHIQTNGYCTTLTVSSYNYGATTGKDKSQSRIFLSPSACECKVVVVATSGDIPASGATDGKLYVVTGSGT